MIKIKRWIKKNREELHDLYVTIVGSIIITTPIALVLLFAVHVLIMLDKILFALEH